MENKINHKKLLEKIIQSNDIIRFASICDQFGAVIEKLPREGLSLLLNEYDTNKLAKAGVDSWYYRKQLSNKIGKGQYAMAVYDKIVRLTIPLDDNHIILIAFDNVEKTPKIVDTIKKIVDSN